MKPDEQKCNVLNYTCQTKYKKEGLLILVSNLLKRQPQVRFLNLS